MSIKKWLELQKNVNLHLVIKTASIFILEKKIMSTNRRVVLLVSNNFDFFYLKKIINKLSIQKINFQLWSLEFYKKKHNKSYQNITTKNIFLKKKKFRTI